MTQWSPPFYQLATPRTIDRPEWPADLREFYELHEGYSQYHVVVGGAVRLLPSGDVDHPDSTDHQDLTIFALEHVEDLPFDDRIARWEPELHDFRAIHWGGCCVGCLDLLYVTAGVHFPRGTIVLCGADTPGVEIHGMPMLVLGRTLADFLSFLERHDWHLHLFAGQMDAPEIARHYRHRNPGLDWG